MTQIVILISAEAEWRAAREILPGLTVVSSPYGEYAEVELGGLGAILFQGGWGKISAAGSAQWAIDHFSPELLVNLGTCGGFSGLIERGTILLAERTVVYDIVEQMGDPDEATRYYASELDLAWLDGLDGAAIAAAGIPFRRGTLVSADRDVLAEDVAGLARDYGALAADWESGAIAWVAKKNGVRGLILRGVTDIIDEKGDDVYGEYALFEARAREMMASLFSLLPKILSGAE